MEVLQIRSHQEPKTRRRSLAHAAFVRDHNCIVQDCTGRPIQAHHVRLGTDCGMGLKPSDRWLVPLCKSHHGGLHQHGETEFQSVHRLNLKEWAEHFVKASPKRRELEMMI